MSVLMCKTSSLSSLEESLPCRSNEAVQLLESLPRRQFFFAEGVCSFDAPGALDLFSGKFGVARMLVKYGAPWVLTYEWSASEDLLHDSVGEKIIKFSSM